MYLKTKKSTFKMDQMFRTYRYQIDELTMLETDPKTIEKLDIAYFYLEFTHSAFRRTGSKKCRIRIQLLYDQNIINTQWIPFLCNFIWLCMHLVVFLHFFILCVILDNRILVTSCDIFMIQTYFFEPLHWS